VRRLDTTRTTAVLKLLISVETTPNCIVNEAASIVTNSEAASATINIIVGRVKENQFFITSTSSFFTIAIIQCFCFRFSLISLLQRLQARTLLALKRTALLKVTNPRHQTVLLQRVALSLTVPPNLASHRSQRRRVIAQQLPRARQRDAVRVETRKVHVSRLPTHLSRRAHHAFVHLVAGTHHLFTRSPARPRAAPQSRRSRSHSSRTAA
jgi:hypothetical protein